MGTLDVLTLGSFGATTEKEDDLVAMFSKIDAISRPVIDAQFVDPFSHRLAVSELAKTETIQPYAYTGSDSVISESIHPVGER